MGSKAGLARLALALVLVGCAQSNQLQPVQSNVWLVSEKREIAIGNEVVKEVEREYPVYQDAELAAYIDQIGQALVRNSDRPNIPYTFKVLDTPLPNAFAVPGGHIYITRGILGVINDEAELAGIIGHEIGHVASRHSAKMIQNSTLAQIGFVALALALGEKMNDNMFQAVNVATNLMFLGYARGDEYQADLLGAKYLHRSGYDPNGMVGGMEGLLSLENRDPLKAEEFLRSHPFTKERITHLKGWIPRIPKEDVWGGSPPLTMARGRETYQRIAAPHAIYPGNDEIHAVIEYHRISLVRGQRDNLAKTLSDKYRDERGRTKADYLSGIDALLARARKIDYQISNVQTEPRREGGAARYDYTLVVTDKNGAIQRESGRAYLEFHRPEPQVWKITSIKTVPTG